MPVFLCFGLREMVKEKETPEGFLNGAKGFLIATQSICDETGCPKQDCFMTYYALACQAIELACKTVMLQSGVSIGQLRGKFGHDISALVAELGRTQCADGLDRRDISRARLMSADYKSRNYHYRRSGYSYSLLLPPIPLEVASNFVKWAESSIR